MSVERRDRVRAYDVYVLVAAIYTGLGAIAVVLAITLSGSTLALFAAMIPAGMAVGLATRLAFGWQPGDRSLDRTVPEEANE